MFAFCKILKIAILEKPNLKEEEEKDLNAIHTLLCIKNCFLSILAKANRFWNIPRMELDFKIELF